MVPTSCWREERCAENLEGGNEGAAIFYGNVVCSYSHCEAQRRCFPPTSGKVMLHEGILGSDAVMVGMCLSTCAQNRERPTP